MAAWWELAYVYDVGVAQFVTFPRPLYPPDDPDGPVEDGPDVEAIKRAVSRLGRWPWPTDPDGAPFDQSYSNAFAHGRSGNVGESGVEGVQRQAGVAKASGAIGERTYDVLLYARIPKGLPHSGEFAMDDRAIALLQEAARRFPPSEEQPSSGADARGLAMSHHERRVGYTENPPNSNIDSRPDGIHTSEDHTAGGAHWLDRQPWCGCWCYYGLEAAGVKGLDSSLASVASIEEAARAGAGCFRGWTTDRSKPKPGDLVVVGGYGVHVETVRGFSGSDTLTYGGNTSPGSSGSQSNGGGAYRRVRYPSEVRGYALVRYPGE